MSTFAKPENALKRADELLNVGQKQAALQALHDLITSKRYRTWQKTMEKIMFKYVELCVDMRKGRYAKDGLIQYRISCQQVNVASLEEVVKHFLKLATERAEKAQAEAQKEWEAAGGGTGGAGGAETAEGEAKEQLADVADLEAEKSPEDLMLSFVSGEKGKERIDRETATPWFKFLWETYRTVLDILRNNSKLEALYAMTAHRAFAFCLQHKRTTEFRRLCEILRNHLINLNKYRDQRDRPDLSQPESLQLYLDTRFEQLKTATELELWQEAFRSVEDIHGLMLLATKAPKAQLMALYYSKLVKIFWKAAEAGLALGSGGVGGTCCMAATGSNCSSLLYHAYAWSRLCYLQRSYNKNLKDKDLQVLSSAVVLAALSIPPYPAGTSSSRAGALVPSVLAGGASAEETVERDRCLRMASLLGIVPDGKSDPRSLLSRSALLQEISGKGLLAFALPQVRELYSVLESEFSPLDLPSRVGPILDSLEELSQQHKLSSASPIPRVDLHQYAPALRRLTALRTLTQVGKVYDVIRIPSLWKMLVPCGPATYVESALLEGINHGVLQAHIHASEGVVKFGEQVLHSDKLRLHLVRLADRLGQAVHLIAQAAPAAAEGAAAQRKRRGEAAVAELKAAVDKEHQRLLLRKVLIERRKEDAEREITEKEREEQLAKLRQQKLTEEAEKQRLAAESLRREEERIRREMEAREEEEARQLLLEKRKGKKGKKVDDTLKLDKRQLMEEAMNEQLKERAEAEKRQQRLSKTLDHTERARREEERPLLEAAYQEFLKEEEKWFHEQQREKAERSAAQHAIDVKEKQRLARMLEDKTVFQEQVESLRWQEFERRRREREEKLAELREIRHAECMLQRKKAYYRREAEARAIAEKEEEERRKREELERKKREEEERLRKLEEIAARQRQREAEAEEKARKERERILGLGGGGAPAASAGGGAPSSGAGESSGGGIKPRSSGAYVPAFKRSAEGAGAGGDPPAPARPTADRWGGDRGKEREREYGRERESDRDAPSAFSSGSRYTPPVRSSAFDRDRERDAPFRDRDTRPGGDRWGGGSSRDPEPPSRAEAPAEPRPAAAAPSGAAAPAKGRFVPPHLRNRG